MGGYAWVFDVTLILFIAIFTYAVGSEGLFGSAVMFVNVLLSGLITFSLYEPCARLIGDSIPFMATMADFVCLIVLYGISFTLIRLCTDMLAPRYVRFHGLVDQTGRYLFGFATGWYLTSMMVCMVETAPIHKKFLGYQWQNHCLWSAGLDRYWLGFAQASTEKFFEWDPPRPFDARSDFIMRYHSWRPFGEPDMTMPGFRQPAASGTESPGAPGAGQGTPGAGGGRPPLDPTGATQQPNL